MHARERGPIPPHCYRVVVHGDRGVWSVRDMTSLSGAERIAEEASPEPTAADPVACIFDDSFQLVDRVPTTTEHAAWMLAVLARLREVTALDDATVAEAFRVPMRRVGRRERPTAWIAGLRDGAAIAISLRRVGGMMVLESGRCEPITVRDGELVRALGQPMQHERVTEPGQGPEDPRTLQTMTYQLAAGTLRLHVRIDSRGFMRFAAMRMSSGT